MAEEEAPRVIDQIVGAVCRLILSNVTLVPLDAVVPVIFKQLPMRVDYDEYDTVFKTLSLLAAHGNGLVLNSLPQIATFSMALFTTDEEFTKDKVLASMRMFWREVQNTKPEQFNAMLESVTQEQRMDFLVKINENC